MTREEFLQRIAQIESSGGTHTNHPVIQHGMHAGFAAIGKYGLMPYTIQDIARNSSDRDVAALAQVDPHDLKPILEQNPELEDKVAGHLANKVLSREGDPVKAAYAWNQGSNLRPEQITPEMLANKDYTQKFQKLGGILNGPQKSSSPGQPMQSEADPEKAHAEDYLKYLNSISPENSDEDEEDEPDEVDQEIEEKSKPKMLALQQLLQNQ